MLESGSQAWLDFEIAWGTGESTTAFQKYTSVIDVKWSHKGPYRALTLSRIQWLANSKSRVKGPSSRIQPPPGVSGTEIVPESSPHGGGREQV